MSRPGAGARLYLRKRNNRPAIWVIRDTGSEVSTGLGAHQKAEAERFLADYLIEKHRNETVRSGDPDQLEIASVLTVYKNRHGPTVTRPDRITETVQNLMLWWRGKTVSTINEMTCREYVGFRTSQPVRSFAESSLDKRLVSQVSARRDLETLRAAINWYDSNVIRLRKIPRLWLPQKSAPRERWLTRQEAARILNALRKPHRRHVARFFLISLYTGTRSTAVLKLGWEPHPGGGWVDLRQNVLYRSAPSKRQTNKRTPPIRLPRKLRAHMERWKKADTGLPPWVISYNGRPVDKVRKAWRGAVEEAGLDLSITPHTLRHTAATWRMQLGVDKWETAGFLGMSIETLERVYGHHHPDYQSRAVDAY